jgi:hypothetical protein
MYYRTRVHAPARYTTNALLTRTVPSRLSQKVLATVARISRFPPSYVLISMTSIGSTLSTLAAHQDKSYYQTRSVPQAQHLRPAHHRQQYTTIEKLRRLPSQPQNISTYPFHFHVRVASASQCLLQPPQCPRRFQASLLAQQSIPSRLRVSPTGAIRASRSSPKHGSSLTRKADASSRRRSIWSTRKGGVVGVRGVLGIARGFSDEKINL